MSVEAAATASTPKQYEIPVGVYVVVDPDHYQWTNIAGAMALAGKSRRTIQQWISNGWVTTRRAAGGRPEIQVASLWQSEQNS